MLIILKINLYNCVYKIIEALFANMSSPIGLVDLQPEVNQGPDQPMWGLEMLFVPCHLVAAFFKVTNACFFSYCEGCKSSFFSTAAYLCHHRFSFLFFGLCWEGILVIAITKMKWDPAKGSAINPTHS